MTEREQQIETVAHKLAAVWPSSVRDDDSLIVSLSARIVDALQGDPANEMEFGGDPDAESPFVIPSREGGAFPQGVGGARVDAAIAKRFASSPEQGDPADERQWLVWEDDRHGLHDASRMYAEAKTKYGFLVVPLALRAEEAARDFAEAAQALYEEVQMAEATGVCLPDRVACLRLGEALARHPGFLPIPTGENE